MDRRNKGSGQMDEWMVKWMNGYWMEMDIGWMNGWMNEWILDGCMDG